MLDGFASEDATLTRLLAASCIQDVRTDAKIQEMIREVFDGCTVFAIAHRLGTIIDYDRICVLEQGKQVEFGA